MYTDELTEEEAEDQVRAPLIAEIRRRAPLLSRDINFDRWSTEKIKAVAERFAKNRAELMRKISEPREDMVCAPLIEQIRRAAPLFGQNVELDLWTTDNLRTLAALLAETRTQEREIVGLYPNQIKIRRNKYEERTKSE